jgi:signal transduction histidine kinase
MADRIERLVRGQKELLANVSHELRSPLARIRVALELLPQNAEGEARVRDVVGDLEELNRLIEDILTTSRLEATGALAHAQPTDVRALLAQLAQRAETDPITAGKRIVVEPGPAVEARADAALLKRAVWNLVENAAKYGAAPITLSAARSDGRVTIAVSDDGPGIPAEERDKVLEPFYRLDRARTPAAAGEAPRGFGLGLTLARRVAEAHGGDIHLAAARTDSGGERGLAVTLDLPA